jgi:hypothetical protein
MSVKLKELKKGDWFTLKNIPEPKENQVWIKDEYDRSSNKYLCIRWSDISDSREVSGDKEVYTEFTF